MQDIQVADCIAADDIMHAKGWLMQLIVILFFTFFFLVL